MIDWGQVFTNIVSNIPWWFYPIFPVFIFIQIKMKQIEAEQKKRKKRKIY
jgi:Na+/H+ antiporter NhaC